MKWRKLLNPVEWLAWVYGKLFLSHAIIGFVVLWLLVAIPLGIVWLRAIDKYNEQHPNPLITSSDSPNQAPRFKHEIRFSQYYPYKEGLLVEGISWTSDMREYIFTISNSQAVEVSNFRERLFLPFAVLHLRLLSSENCDGASISVAGDEPSQSIAVHENKIIAMGESNGNWALATAAKMRPGGKMVIKMIGTLTNFPIESQHFWLLYGCDFPKAGQLMHYGRMVRPLAIDDSGRISIGEEFHKKGHSFPVQIIGYGSTRNDATVHMPVFNPLAELADRPDDQ